jgi:lipopolysaccharide export system protein LptA
MTRRQGWLAALGGLAWLVPAATPLAQQLDLSHGGPIEVTAAGGIEWRQNELVVIAYDDARAVRGNVTVTADRLIAHYRKKAGAQGAAASTGAGGQAGGAQLSAANQPPAGGSQGGISGADADTSGNEIYRLDAEGHVHIFTATDQAWGDHATYDLDQAVMVMTGKHLKLTTPNDVLTCRDDMEYWSQKHMAVARGDAVVVTNDGRRLAADTLVAYTTDSNQPNTAAAGGPNKVGANGQAPVTKAAARPGADSAQQDQLAASGRLQKVEAYGHVVVTTQTDVVTGDRAVYVPETGIARIGGNVRITRGQNQLNGAEAEVNVKTGISRLISAPAQRVQGLVIPNDATNRQMPPGTAAPAEKAKPSTPGKQP